MTRVAPDWQQSAEIRADARWERQESAENLAISEVSLSSAFARELRRVLLEGLDDPESGENVQVGSACIPEGQSNTSPDLMEAKQ
jgi:hypothetical protein